MKLTQVITKVFYADITVGLEFFVDFLGFRISYQENDPAPFYIVNRDEIRFILIENAEWAAKDRPEIRIETDDIDAYYSELVSREKTFFHPNLSKIKAQPWGLKEFATLDRSTVCVIIQQPIQ